MFDIFNDEELDMLLNAVETQEKRCENKIEKYKREQSTLTYQILNEVYL